MNELNSATVNALKLTLGNKAFFSVKEVANIMCVSVNKINDVPPSYRSMLDERIFGTLSA